MFVDKFINSVILNDQNPDEDDYLDDDYSLDEDYDEEKPKKSLFAKRQEPEEDGYFDEEDEPVEKTVIPKPFAKVTPMKQQPPKKGVNTNMGMEVCVIKPTSVEEAREITETLLEDRTVVLNLEGLDVGIAQRIIDFTSGSCYAIQGNLQKISSYIFIITPASVDISGDFQDILAGSFDVPAINTEM